MTKKEYWNLFKETGKIEYYLKYKKTKQLNAKKIKTFYMKIFQEI